MAFQTITHSLLLPRWQSNRPVFGIPNCVWLHEYKSQKTWCCRSVFKKKSSGYEAEDRINLKWDAGDSKEESNSVVIASEDNIKMENGKTLEEDGSLEALVKKLLVEAAVQKDMIAAQERMIVDLQRRAAPMSEITAAQEQTTIDFQRRVSQSSELTTAQDQRILDLQRKVEELEFSAAQQQVIADLQKKVAQLELDAKLNTETPPTEIHAHWKSERKTPSTEIHAKSKSKTKTPTREIHVKAKSKAKTNRTRNHVSGYGETDEHREKNSLVYFPESSDEEEHTGVDDDYTMAAMKALKRMQLDLNAESKSKTNTPPTENRVSGDGDADGQRERNPLVYFPASSDKEEQTGLEDDYAMAAMKALKRMQLNLNSESKSKTKSPPTENHVSGDGETDEQRERNPLVYFPASSDKEEHTGVEDDYVVAAMKALQRMQLDPNAESKSKMETFSSSSDEKQSGFKDDDYTTAVMNVLLKMQLEQNAESKSKMETPLRTPQTKIQLSDGETNEEEHSSDIVEQRERTQPVKFSASSDEEKHSRYKDEEYTNAVMNQISKPHKMRLSRKPRNI